MPKQSIQQPEAPPLEELWHFYQQEHAAQQAFRKIHRSGAFKDKVSSLRKSLITLEKRWKELEEDQFFFFNVFFEPDSLPPFFADDGSMVSSPYGPVRDTEQAYQAFLEKLQVAIRELKAVPNLPGNDEKLANKALVFHLLNHWYEKTGEKPKKYDDNPAVVFVIDVIHDLQAMIEHLRYSNLAAQELFEFINIPITCEQIIDARFPKKN